MAKRIGIGEAETVTLGEGGRQQFIPVLEAFPDSTRVPGKTSISAMAEFFEGGGPVLMPQIQRFFIDDSPLAILRPINNQNPGQFSTIVKINFQKESNSLILGDEDFYTLANGNVTISKTGTYKIIGNIACKAFEQGITGVFTTINLESVNVDGDIQLDGEDITFNLFTDASSVDIDFEINQPSLLRIIHAGTAQDTEQFYSPTNGNLETIEVFNKTFGQFTKWVRINENQEVIIAVQCYNNGSGPATESGSSFLFESDLNGTRSTITIERLSS